MLKLKLMVIWAFACIVVACNSNSPKTADVGQAAASADTSSNPLPSWNSGPVKTRIIDYVKAATDTGSETFIPIADRVATFDNDGTLWSEQPIISSFSMPWIRSKPWPQNIRNGKPHSPTKPCWKTICPS